MSEDVNKQMDRQVAHIRQLQSEVQQWQRDYETLRIQKGGFGFKAMAACGLAFMLAGLFLGWWAFRQKDPNAVLFHQFNQSAGFQLEYHLAHREYVKAEQLLNRHRHDPTFSPIRPELDLLLNLVRAAQMHPDSSAGMIKTDKPY